MRTVEPPAAFPSGATFRNRWFLIDESFVVCPRRKISFHEIRIVNAQKEIEIKVNKESNLQLLGNIL